MSYIPTTDFIALLRQTGGGLRMERMPGLDYVVAALARASLFYVWTGLTPPVTNQLRTVWFRPYVPSYAAEGSVWLWSVQDAEYQPATPELWSDVLVPPQPTPPEIVQDIVDPGPANVLTDATVVRVNQTIGAPITVVMPLASTKVGGVLISDWKGDAGVNNITVTLSGADELPGGFTSWVIAADIGSLYLRPVPGGYAI